MATSSGALTGTSGKLSTQRWAELDAEFQKLTQKDIEALSSVARLKTSVISHQLAYREKPPSESVVRARVARAIQPRSNNVVSLEELPRLDRVLLADSEALAGRELLYGRKRLVAEDLSTNVLRRSEASLNWVDVDRLDASLDCEDIDTRSDAGSSFCGTFDRHSLSRRSLHPSVLRSADAGGASPSSAEGCFSPTAADSVGSPGSPAHGFRSNESRAAGLSATKWLGGSRHSALQKRRWPSEARFDRYYKVPFEHMPPDKPEPKFDRLPLPPPRKTISALEESSSFGAQAYLWPALLEAREFEDRRGAGHAPSMIKGLDGDCATDLYSQTCERYCTPPLSPRPKFGERVEVAGAAVEGTRQCYALAEVIQSCAAREVILKDCCLTDMGAAKIIEMAFCGGQLQRLEISGSPLSYATCVALHDGMRTRSGSSLVELSLSLCGLGADLDIDPLSLREPHSAAYVRGNDLLQRVIAVAEEKEKALACPIDEVGLDDRSVLGVEQSPLAASSSHHDTNFGRSASTPALLTSAKGSLTVTRTKSDDSKVESSQEQPDSSETIATPLLLPVFGLLAQPGSALRKLDLSRTSLSNTTVAFLSKTLRCSALESLNLSHCGLDDDSLDLIATGLASNRGLLELNLRRNAFGCIVDATNNLLDAASRHVRLAHLDLAENDLPQGCTDQLCSLLCWSCSLVAIHLLGSGVQGPDAVELMEACQRWTSENATEEHLRESTEVQSPLAGGSSSKDSFVAEETVTYLFSELEYDVLEADALGQELLRYLVNLLDADAPQLKVKLYGGTLVAHITGGTDTIEELREKAATISIKGTFAEIVEELVLCRALHVRGLSDWRVVSPPAKRVTKPTDVYQGSGSVASEAAAAKPIAAPSSWMPPCCWICAKCPPVEIRWFVPDRGVGEDAGGSGSRVFARPSFAEFARIELKRQRINGARRVCYSSQFLVPHGKHFYLLELEIGGQTTFICSREDPSVDMADVPLTPQLREELDRVCRKSRYKGPLNALAPVSGDGFQISEQVVEESVSVNVDPWADDPARQRLLRECYELDMGVLNFCDLCHVSEEPEVRRTLWDIYGVLYETYAIFAGRSQWPFVRQVDVYGFFEEARILKSRGPASAGSSGSPDSPQRARGGPTPPPLSLQDVQQLLVQTVTKRRVPSSGATGGTGQRRTSLARRAASLQQRTQEGAPITRPQFIEVTLRAALVLRGRQTDSTALAFRAFADKVLRARIMQAPLTPFPRGLVLQVGEVCDALLAHRKILREAWERFGGSEGAFQRLAQLLKMCDRAFTAKHMASIYALSRRPKVECISASAQTRGLAFDEFCEAILRLALIARKPARPGEESHGTPTWPPQPVPGRPVRQRAVAARLATFVARVAERMRPAVRLPL
eukprot:TRINITY_DN13037_c1_g2_i1.p1 TRINITY_DN13037_c1_g2~~TRINITY_DN13037_c1_g2_i1.p1  ORF type:complete len:1391 (-),score=172.68 TRINITY_DN13037_c1_g2_i1:106-4278(-)